jgi:PhzF family phenazine biosynthesis protein
MKKLIVYQVDSFTKEKFRGNPAGVVVNADGLNEQEMQMIARELNNSETAFIFSPKDSSYDGEIRYFTPTKEVPICGHATIGAMYALAIEKNMDPCVMKIKTQVGFLPFEIIKSGGDYQIVMTQGAFSLSNTLSPEVSDQIIKSLGLTQNDLDPRCPIQIASTGHSKVMIGIKSRKQLNQLTPDLSKLAQLSNEIQCNGYFVFTFDSDNSDILTYGRMFAPAIGISEDPVTGNANGPLGGYLVQNKIMDPQDGQLSFQASQGEAIHRMGTMSIHVQVRNELIACIQIKGSAIVAFKTEILC